MNSLQKKLFLSTGPFKDHPKSQTFLSEMQLLRLRKNNNDYKKTWKIKQVKEKT